MTYEIGQTKSGCWCVNLRDGADMYRGPVFSADLTGHCKAKDYAAWCNRQHEQHARKT